MAFSNEIQSTVAEQILPKVIDTVLDGNVLTSRVFRKWRKVQAASYELKIPVQYQQSTQGGSYSGLDPLDHQTEDNVVKATFDIRQHYMPIVFPAIEMKVANNANAVLDTVAMRMKQSGRTMLDQIGTAFYGAGTGNNNKDFLGLAAGCDDGNTVATYAGLARATYTTWVSTVTAAASNKITLAQIDTMLDAVTHGSMRPTIIITTPTILSLIGQLHNPTLSSNVSAMGTRQQMLNPDGMVTDYMVGNIGFTTIVYKGIPIVADDKCTAGYMYFLNENDWFWYSQDAAVTEEGESMISIGGMGPGQSDSAQDDSPLPGFAWSGWRPGNNQDGFFSFFKVYGNVCCENPRNQGVITGITGI